MGNIHSIGKSSKDTVVIPKLELEKYKAQIKDLTAEIAALTEKLDKLEHESLSQKKIITSLRHESFK